MCLPQGSWWGSVRGGMGGSTAVVWEDGSTQPSTALQPPSHPAPPLPAIHQPPHGFHPPKSTFLPNPVLALQLPPALPLLNYIKHLTHHLPILLVPLAVWPYRWAPLKVTHDDLIAKSTGCFSCPSSKHLTCLPLLQSVSPSPPVAQNKGPQLFLEGLLTIELSRTLPASST